MAKRYFEYKDAKSKKFWEVSVSGKKVNIRYGKLGTDGETSVKELGTPAEAKAHAEKQAAAGEAHVTGQLFHPKNSWWVFCFHNM